jgi:hypothetical protein
VPISPPLTTLSDARPRLIEMDTAALAALHRRPVRIATYIPPRNFHAVIFLTCLSTFLLLARGSSSAPDSVLAAGMPVFAAFVARVRLWVLVPMVVVHAVEAGVMVRRLGGLEVRVGGGVWWLWVGSAFVEGWGSFVRLGRLVEAEEGKGEKEKGRH